MLNEISHHKKTNTVSFHLYEIPRVVKIIETEGRMLTTSGLGKREWEVFVEWICNFSFVNGKFWRWMVVMVHNNINVCTELCIKKW